LSAFISLANFLFASVFFWKKKRLCNIYLSAYYGKLPACTHMCGAVSSYCEQTDVRSTSCIGSRLGIKKQNSTNGLTQVSPGLVLFYSQPSKFVSVHTQQTLAHELWQSGFYAVSPIFHIVTETCIANFRGWTELPHSANRRNTNKRSKNVIHICVMQLSGGC